MNNKIIDEVAGKLTQAFIFGDNELQKQAIDLRIEKLKFKDDPEVENRIQKELLVFPKKDRSWPAYCKIRFDRSRGEFEKEYNAVKNALNEMFYEEDK